MTAVKLARQEETVVTSKPRYDSKSKRLVENAHQLVQAVPRTWGGVDREALPNDTESGVTSCALGCAPLWLESLRDTPSWRMGLTPYRKLRGREYGGAIAELCETLSHVQGLNQKFPRRCNMALWVGKMSSTHE